MTVVGVPVLSTPSQSIRDTALKPTAAIAETVPRWAVAANGAQLAVGTLSIFAIGLPAGVSIGHIAVQAGSTPANTPTDYWFCLLDSNLNLLAITADQGSAAWGGNVLKSLAIANIAAGAASSFVTAYEGLYYIGIMVAGTGAPTILSTGSLTAAENASMPPILAAATTDTGLTVPLTFPHQCTAAAATGNHAYAYVAA